MRREFHVRFCEGGGVRFPSATRLVIGFTREDDARRVLDVLPKRFGNWHTIYTRMNRWAKAGVLDRLFAELQREQLIRSKIEAVSLDSTIVKVHPDGTGALKKTDRKPSASRAAARPPRFIWLPRMLERQ